jgi:hypothetical protein
MLKGCKRNPKIIKNVIIRISNKNEVIKDIIIKIKII